MKRVYKTVSLEPGSNTLLLDGKPARTPMGQSLVLPHKKLAAEIAKEWEAQGKEIRKDTMPFTQMACIAIDLIGVRKSEVVEDVLGYAETDLVCYRAANIPVLMQEQEELLSPILAWAQSKLGLELNITGGLMPVAQPQANALRLRTLISEYDDWHLALLAGVTKPLGSIILALAFMRGRIDAKQAFILSHLEEAYETRQWGEDEQKEQKLQKIIEEMKAAEKFLALLQ